MYEVQDGNRVLRFEGELLAESSSKRHDSVRWIEFRLYKTNSGTYVLSRVGASTVFHASVCPLVEKYGLHELSPFNLSPNAEPCDECEPTHMEPLVYPEKYRYWTLTTTEPEVVLDALYKYDGSGTRYLTKVAERVLEQAADRDADIDQAYRVEVIP